MADTSDVQVSVKAEATNNRKSALQKEYDARGYKPVCCGNSSQDLVIITVCLLVLWGFTAGVFVALLQASLDTDTTSTALWLYFGVFAMGASFLALVLAAGDYEMKLKGGGDKE